MKKPRWHFFLILVHCLGGHAGIVLWITLKRHFYDAILQSYHMRWRFANRSPPSGITTISSFRNSVLYLPYQNSSTGILYWNGNAATSLPILHSWHNLNCFTSSTYICVCGANDRLLLLWTLLLIHHFHTYATWEYKRVGICVLVHIVKM